MTDRAFAGPEGQEDMPWLLTPGPLTTSRAVKFAMLADYGSRDEEFLEIVEDVRQGLLRVAGGGPDFECVLLQGPGTYAIEAALGAFTPDKAKRKKTLVVVNGAYGRRACQILARLGRPYVAIEKDEDTAPSLDDLNVMLDADKAISHVWLIHCETTSGILNPVDTFAKSAKARGKTVLIDAMSSFGAIPVPIGEQGADVIVAASGKCLEGVPGLAFVIARRDLLESSKDRSHSIAFDLHDQWARYNKDRQFRFTPPTHVIAALREAIAEHEAEGGSTARHARYRKNAETLMTGMRAMGFVPLLKQGDEGPIIHTFLPPRDPAYNFEKFRAALKAKGFAIYPGALTQKPTFRIGTIGALDDRVIAQALEAIRATVKELGLRELGPATS